MKQLFFVLVLAFCIQCKSTQFDSNPPFTLTQGTYTAWVGGQPGVRGTHVMVPFTAPSEVTFLRLYFGNNSTPINVKGNADQTAIHAYFTDSKEVDKVFSLDPKKEHRNSLPKGDKPKFLLAANEAVISYQEGDEIKYVKVVLTKNPAPKFQ